MCTHKYYTHTKKKNVSKYRNNWRKANHLLKKKKRKTHCSIEKKKKRLYIEELCTNPSFLDIYESLELSSSLSNTVTSSSINDDEVK